MSDAISPDAVALLTKVDSGEVVDSRVPEAQKGRPIFRFGQILREVPIPVVSEIEDVQYRGTKRVGVSQAERLGAAVLLAGPGKRAAFFRAGFPDTSGVCQSPRQRTIDVRAVDFVLVGKIVINLERQSVIGLQRRV